MRDLNATVFYKAKFDVAARVPEHCDLLWLLVMDIQRWITRKLNWGNRSRVETDLTTWSHFKMGGKLYDKEGANTFFAESAYREGKEDGSICWGCRIVEKPEARQGYAPREWVTEIGYRSFVPGKAEISYVVTFRDTPGYIGPCEPAPLPTVPKVIRSLLQDRGVDCSIGGDRIGSQPILLNPGDYEQFRALLLNPKREVPVVYVSPRWGEDGAAQLLVNPALTAEAVMGNALVYYSEDMEFSREMRCSGDVAYTCSGGAVRIYFPHPDPTNPDDSYRHRFIPAQTIEEWGEASVLQILRRALAQDVHYYESMFRLSSCRALIEEDRHRAHLEEVRSTGEHNVDEAMQAFISESDKRQDAEVRLLEMEDQLADRDRDIYQLKTRLEALTARAAYSGLANEATQKMRKIDTLPNTPLKVAEYFELLYPERIAFTERGRRSLEDCITKPEILWEIFYCMVNDLYDLLQNAPANAYREFKARTGWDCGRGEGPMTHRDPKLMRQYVDQYEGQEIDIEPHIKNGNKNSDPRSVRIHFAYDPSVSEKILVGHCGKHLDNYSTRKVK